MKSFADWTEEIRLLMNPPKPAPQKNDTIYWDPGKGDDHTAHWPALVRRASSNEWPEVLAAGPKLSGEAIHQLNDWQLRLMHAIHQGVARQAAQITVSCGRRQGQTFFRNCARALERIPPEQLFEYKEDGSVHFHGIDELKRRGLL